MISLPTARKVRGRGSRGSGTLGGQDIASLQQQLQDMKDKVSLLYSIAPYIYDGIGYTPYPSLGVSTTSDIVEPPQM